MILSGFPLTGGALQGNLECSWHDDPYVTCLKASSKLAACGECCSMTTREVSCVQSAGKDAHLWILPKWLQVWIWHITVHLQEIKWSICRFKLILNPHSFYQSQQKTKRSLFCACSAQWFGGAKQFQHPHPTDVLLLGITASTENVLTWISAFSKYCMLHTVYNSNNIPFLSWSLVEELKRLRLTPESV